MSSPTDEQGLGTSRKFLDRAGEWKWAGIRKYLKQVKKFEEFLLVLAHTTGGNPAEERKSRAYA
jgi:hypothetical protein